MYYRYQKLRQVTTTIAVSLSSLDQLSLVTDTFSLRKQQKCYKPFYTLWLKPVNIKFTLVELLKVLRFIPLLIQIKLIPKIVILNHNFRNKNQKNAKSLQKTSIISPTSAQCQTFKHYFLKLQIVVKKISLENKTLVRIPFMFVQLCVKLQVTYSVD